MTDPPEKIAERLENLTNPPSRTEAAAVIRSLIKERDALGKAISNHRMASEVGDPSQVAAADKNLWASLNANSEEPL